MLVFCKIYEYNIVYSKHKIISMIFSVSEYLSLSDYLIMICKSDIFLYINMYLLISN